ncbi:hypothetical protein Tco_0613430 [Tanacetum coccineum]
MAVLIQLVLGLNGFSSTMMVLGIPVMSACVYAKMSALALSKFRNSFLKCSGKDKKKQKQSKTDKKRKILGVSRDDLFRTSGRGSKLFAALFVAKNFFWNLGLDWRACLQMCLCELILLAKVRSKLCFEIFVIKDATCFLTVPPYSGGVFKGIGVILITADKGCYELKPFGKRLVEFGLAYAGMFGNVDGTCPPCGRLAKLPTMGELPSKFAEGSPWVVH